MSSLDYESEYNNRARVPAHPAIIAGWERDAAAYRLARRNRSELGIAYGRHSRQTIDLFHPDSPDDSRPLVILIHGGYWRSLDPSLFSHWTAGANSHGYSVAVPGYRLCPEVAVADIVADVSAACLFLYRRFRKRLVGCGHSAGGHLAAAMVATDWGVLGADIPTNLLRHGLAISGVFDLAPLVVTSMNEQLQLDEATAKAMSPAHWPIRSGTHFEAWVGGMESREFLRQSQLVAEHWAAAGARTRFQIMPDANHFTAPNPLAEPASGLVAALVGLCEAAET